MFPIQSRTYFAVSSLKTYQEVDLQVKMKLQILMGVEFDLTKSSSPNLILKILEISDVYITIYDKVEKMYDPNLVRLVQVFLETSTWEEEQSFLNKHKKDLFSKEAKEILVSLQTMAEQQNMDAHVQDIAQHLALLEFSQMIGIDAAYKASYEIATVPFHTSSSLTRIMEMSSISDMPSRVAECEEALRSISKNTTPMIWAFVQGILAESLVWDRSKPNFDQAILHYEQAQTVFSRDRYPAAWAYVEGELGMAFWWRGINGGGGNDIEESLIHVKEALSIQTSENNFQECGKLHSYLCNIYQDRISGEQTQNIEDAISHGLKALEVYTRVENPKEWAIVFNNLGKAYTKKKTDPRVGEEIFSFLQLDLVVMGETGAKPQPSTIFDIAQMCFHFALSELRKDVFPWWWANVQFNLATLYWQFSENNNELLDYALHYYNEALNVYEQYPIDKKRVRMHRGNVYTALAE